MNEQGTVIALIWNVAGRSELSLYDVQDQRMVEGPQLPAEIAVGLEFTKDGHHLAMVLSGSAAPEDVWVFEMRTKQFTQVTHGPYAGVDLRRWCVRS
jgi:hypothetical protein